MSTTVVDQLHDEFVQLVKFLEESDSFHLRDFAGNYFGKILLLAAASYFERRLIEHVESLCGEFLGSNHPLTFLIKGKAIIRQYHTWFDWKVNNANKFFGLFGDSFQMYAKSEIDNDSNLESSIRNFMEIGQDRNRMLHQDFARFSMEKTPKEVYDSYSSANKFVEWFPCAIREHLKA